MEDNQLERGKGKRSYTTINDAFTKNHLHFW